jgi:hypothetical protein
MHGVIRLELEDKCCVSERYPSSCFYSKDNVSGTGFCVRLQVKPTPHLQKKELALVNDPN